MTLLALAGWLLALLFGRAWWREVNNSGRRAAWEQLRRPVRLSETRAMRRAMRSDRT